MTTSVRGVVLRLLAAAFALSWLLLPGFGLIDLSVTWSPDWPQVLEAGWGLYFTFIVGAPFLLTAVRPEQAGVAVVQLAIATTVLVVSVPASDEPQLLWIPVAIAVQTAVLALLAGLRPAPAGRIVPSVPLLAAALLGAVPWLLYALAMSAANREGRSDTDITNDIDHYSVQGALGFALVVLSLVAAAWAPGRRFIGTCVGASAAYLGLVSFVWADAAGGVDAPWSAASMLWGVAVVVLSWRASPSPSVAVA